MPRYLIFTSAFALSLSAAAQGPSRPTPVDSQLFRGMEWRTIGPNRGDERFLSKHGSIGAVLL